ncbi:MmgE/PrpD family protein [Aquabacter sp. L1I39]|uniref:MmgE/PrpD family protein n=1 Tax=Aquabacter sp. L1I39 TaxID=2820278 RepID=UPI001AD97C3F|nr:MmgE/PrpD family protein [Aquabacter sp. L1I39]QTL05892.1 MmgE/PrpD family protein [Aquabacter sp. L1I39]
MIPADKAAVAPLSASDRLAAFVADYCYEAIPPAVRHEARRSLLNMFATAFAGACDPAIESLWGALAPFCGPQVATQIGRGGRVDAPTAAFLNAAAANVFDFDDTHPGTVIHPTAPVAPALLALAELRPDGRVMSGRDFLAAFILGVEVECRIGNAVSPGHYARGWHITATCGVFGAAAASGRALGLDALRVRDAFGHAAAQACGLVEALGTPAKSFGVGNSARNGLISAFAARNGAYGPARPLDGERGFLNLTCDDPRPEDLTMGLGETWELAENTYKPYPSGVVLHPVTDACLALRAAPGFDVSAIAEIVVRGHPLLRQRTDRPHVSTGREAQVSAHHTVAAVLIDGAAGLTQYTTARVCDPAVQALRAKVRMEDDPAMEVEAAVVSLRFADGRTVTEEVAHALGSRGRPLSDADLEHKLRTLAPLAEGCAPDALIDAVWSLEDLSDAATLLRHARP